MFEELLKRLPDIELDGDPQLLRSHFIDGVKSMPVSYTPEVREGGGSSSSVSSPMRILKPDWSPRLCVLTRSERNVGLLIGAIGSNPARR